MQEARILLLEARLRRREGRLDEAERLYREVLRRTRDRITTEAQRHRGKELQGEVLHRTRDRGPQVLPIVPTALSGLGFTLQEQGKHDDAVAAFREALQIWLESHSDEDPLVAAGLASLAQALMEAGQWEEAEVLLGKALEIRRAIWPEDQKIVSETRDLLARCRRARDRSGANNAQEHRD